jgi:hypothetical protein
MSDTNDRVKPKYRTDSLTLRPDSLVGSYFHSFEERDGSRRIRWQGVVVAEPVPGVYLIETFEWLAGTPYEQQLVRIEDMLDWSFYDDADWLGNAYRRRVEARDE